MSGDWIPLGLPDQIRRVLPKVNVVSLGRSDRGFHLVDFVSHPESESELEEYSLRKSNAQPEFPRHESGFCAKPTWVPGQLYIGGLAWRRDTCTMNKKPTPALS